MPWVTDWDSPAGLPMASTTSPTFKRELSPNFATGKRRLRIAQVFFVDLEHREVGQRIGAHQRGPQLLTVGQAHGDAGGAARHVVVGQDQAIG